MPLDEPHICLDTARLIPEPMCQPLRAVNGVAVALRGLYAHRPSYLSPEVFALNEFILLLLMADGMSSLHGVIFGAHP